MCEMVMPSLRMADTVVYPELKQCRCPRPDRIGSETARTVAAHAGITSIGIFIEHLQNATSRHIRLQGDQPVCAHSGPSVEDRGGTFSELLIGARGVAIIKNHKIITRSVQF